MAVVAAVGFWAGTKQFAGLVRKRVIKQLETATGGRVEIQDFRWNALGLEAEARGLIVHGTEEPLEPPYLQLDRLTLRLSVIGVLSPQILLRDLEVIRPQFHLILYPNGTTNQPHPRQATRMKHPALETLFNLEAGHVAVEQGQVDIDNRTAWFDFQNRYVPLDFAADDTSLLLKYVPASAGTAESYHMDAGIRDLTLARGGASAAAPPAVHGFLQASIDLTKDAVYLRSMRLTASTRGAKDRTLEVSGRLYDFAHARWQATASGELDLRLLNPVLGYPFAPEGLARLQVQGAGSTGEFRFDGTLHVDDGAYVAPGVTVHNLRLDSKVHADPSELRVTGIDFRLQQGGRVEGDLTLNHWLPHIPGQATIQPVPANPAQKPAKHFWNRHKAAVPAAQAAPPLPASRSTLLKAPVQEITVNGKVTANFEDVPIDAVLDIVGQDPFKRLGIDARLNGPATATWVNGDVNTLAVTAQMSMNAPPQPAPNEAPASGMLEGTYTQKDGAVDLRRMEVHLPASELQAHGTLGAYPLTSATNLDVDFESRNLAEFDTVLRALGLNRKGKSGSAALPVALSGQASFHGNWGGSLLSPRLSGEAKATQLAMEIPVGVTSPTAAPQWVRWDSVEASGSYSADRIAIVHSVLRRGDAQVLLDGTLSAIGVSSAPGQTGEKDRVRSGAEVPGFDANSLLHARIEASHVSTDQLLPLLGLSVPLSGSLDAHLESDGPLRNPGASGWVELNHAVVYGEPIERVRAQGTVANHAFNLSSIAVNAPAGSIAGSGSYNMQSRRFDAEAHASGINVSRIDSLHRAGENLTGNLDFAFTGSGTLDEPHLEGHATLMGFAVGSEPLGALRLTAHTVGRNLDYQIASQFKTAVFSVNGQTELHGDLATTGKLEFSQFNIGALLTMAHVEGISGESALAGEATFQGPLAHAAMMQGDARLQVMEVTIAGVHLASKGGLHANLSNGRVTLDPVHIVGDQTDLHAQGTLSLKDKRQLDFTAGGSVNLKLAETLDRDVTAGGTTTFQVEAHGPLANPGLRGKIEFDNGSLALEDVPNGLSQLHGTLEFNQNRLEVRSLTAMSGGGQLSVSGYLAYQRGLFADLTVQGNSIRIRYPQGVSSLADTTLHLQGTQPNLLLSGSVLLTRFSVSPDLDVAALAAQANAVQPVAAPDAPSSHIRLDIRVRSSPQLNFQNAYAKLAGDIDLRLRGTVASPSLLGRISITEGNATIAGTRYELQRGDIQFTNPVRIQPIIDLNATARVEDYDITLGLHGTQDRLAISYRSDPPLPEADVVALLALGRTQSEQGIYTQQQEQSAGVNPSTDVLLGGALNATVSSRVQKLFGAGAVKVDPSYIGALGNSTTRITVDEQLGKNVTLTYATNVDTSAQQLLQAEVAINRHVSVLVTRDESGVFSMVLKAIRRYR
jgi:translocation and assembly module TamB